MNTFDQGFGIGLKPSRAVFASGGGFYVCCVLSMNIRLAKTRYPAAAQMQTGAAGFFICLTSEEYQAFLFA